MPLLLLALCLTGSVARVDLEEPSGPDMSSEGAPASSDPTLLDAPILVLLVGDRAGDAADASAIAAHLHGLDVALHVRAGAPADVSAIEQYRVASRIASEERARAVLWVERDADRGYLLHVVRPEERAIYTRQVERDDDAASVGLEALGIVTRSIAGAVASDAPLEMDVREVPPEPAVPLVEPTPSPTAPPIRAASRTRGRALIAVGYAGTSYAREIPWQSGIAVQGAWGWPFGLHVGAGYAAMQRVRAASPIGTIEVRRHPTEAFAGWHWRIRSLWLGAEALLIVDPAIRIARGDAPRTSARPDRALVSTAIAPRGRIAVIAGWRVEVFASVALEVWLSRVRHAVSASSGDVREVLSPRRIRATTAVGVAVRL